MPMGEHLTLDHWRNNAPNTRGRPFSPGNSGKPKGARNRSTRLLEKILFQDASDVAEAVVKAAKSGDMQAAKLILDRVAPVPRGRRLRIDLPALNTAADVLAAGSAVIAAMAAGEVSPE